MDQSETAYRAFLSGDDEAFVEIIRVHRDGLIYFINSLTRNLSLAEELAEDTLFELLVKRPRYNPSKGSFKTWLYAMGRNRAVNHLKRTARVTLGEEAMEHMTDDETPALAYLKEERERELHKALSRIHPDYRTALYLSYFEGLDNGEIARVMNGSRRRVEMLLYRGKQALKKELEKEGFIYEEL